MDFLIPLTLNKRNLQSLFVEPYNNGYKSMISKVVIFGGAGRVGFGLAGALMQRGLSVVVVDCIPQQRLAEMVARLAIDTRLSSEVTESRVAVYGDVDVLDEPRVTELLVKEQPQIVVNYAIPFTWDASKQLANYRNISAAGLGAFAAVQVLAPKLIGRAIAASGIDAQYIVGNLPDITVPILTGLSQNQPLVPPLGGAGNVGLIEAAIRNLVARQQQLPIKNLSVALVAHHVHWVAPREPGYRNDAPFLLKVWHRGEDVSENLGDARELMNRAIVQCYESGAGFSSTTSLLAAQFVSALLDQAATPTSLHIPAPNGLPGGYPVIVKGGQVSLNLPPEWQRTFAIECMQQAHRRDGIDKIGSDGTIHFVPESVAILKKELGIVLPEVLMPSELEAVATEQIRLARRAIGLK